MIVGFNGQKITSSRNLQLEVASTKPGSKAPVEIIRNGDSKTLDVTIEQQPGGQEVAGASTEKSKDTGTLTGVAVDDLDPQARQQYNIPRNVTGVLITQVDPTSAAAQAGLKAGQVIQSINRHQVTNADDAVQLTERPGSKRTLLRVWADGGSHFVVVDENNKVG